MQGPSGRANRSSQAELAIWAVSLAVCSGCPAYSAFWSGSGPE